MENQHQQNTEAEFAVLRTHALQQQKIMRALTQQFALEDEGLRYALAAARRANLPEIQISPLQGKLLQFLATACQAHKILEIGSLGGYSGLWLARALPATGRLITLEVNPEHAQIAREVFQHAGVGEQTEVHVGRALEVLPSLVGEAPFDLIFIDANRSPYPKYLDWALRLARPGSIIVGDNCIMEGEVFGSPEETGSPKECAGLAEFNRRLSSDPRLVSLALCSDDALTDGFAMAVVKA